MPLPRIKTRVLAVPRSIAMSWAKDCQRRSIRYTHLTIKSKRYNAPKLGRARSEFGNQKQRGIVDIEHGWGNYSRLGGLGFVTVV